tara:strand:- start:424 stop:618 length:195 start_codon:yes stop_codon:yes gene_type:complete
MEIKIKDVEIHKKFTVIVNGEELLFEIKKDKNNQVEYIIDGMPYDSTSPYHDIFITNWPQSFLI